MIGIKAFSKITREIDRPAEELYKVDEDPYEVDNLAANPEYAEVKKRLGAEIKSWMDRQGDPGAALDDPEVHAANRAAAGEKKKRGKKTKK